MSSVENTKQIVPNPTIKREALVKDTEKLNSIFEKYDLDGNGELDSSEVNKALDEFARINTKSKKELVAEGYTKEEIKATKSFMSNFFKEFKKDFFLDGEINFSAQGRYGNCGNLGDINALSYTDGGKEAIREAISQDEDGNITVEFKGVGKKYTFTKEELQKEENDLLNGHKNAGGDHDVQVLEYAFKLYRQELIEETKDNPERNSSIYTYVGGGTKKDPIRAGELGATMFILTGKKNNSYYKSGTMEEYKEHVKNSKPNDKNRFPIDMKEADIVFDDVSKYLDKQANEPGRYAQTCTFDSGKLIKHHAYSIKEVHDDYVILVNPHNSAAETKVSKTDFLKNLESFCSTDMKTEE